MPHESVVIVEDHVMVRQLLAHLLVEQLQLKLVADCTTVAEGTAAVLREKPALVVVDWRLPDGRGFDVVRQAAPKLPRTRWLMLSSNEQGHLVREAVSLGVHGFVMKRADTATLREGVRRVLAGETYYCPTSARLLVDRLVGESQATGTALTTREREVLRGFAEGVSTKELASRLGMNVRTLQNHLSALKEKLGLREPAELVRYAIKHGYVENP